MEISVACYSTRKKRSVDKRVLQEDIKISNGYF